jgi:DoxX-like family
MNVLLWIVQAALALLCLAGGSYKVFHFDEIAKLPQTMALSRGGWGALGMFEMLCAVLLVVPGVAKWMPVLTPLAAAALALESRAGIVVGSDADSWLLVFAVRVIPREFGLRETQRARVLSSVA